MPKSREYTIAGEHNGHKKQVVVPGETLQLAVKRAEKLWPGFRAETVSTTQEITGHCGRCGAYILDDENTRTRAGSVRCSAC